MFNVGFTEIIAIFVLALVFLGPKELPVAAAALAKLLRDFRRGVGDLQEYMEDSLDINATSAKSSPEKSKSHESTSA